MKKILLFIKDIIIASAFIWLPLIGSYMCNYIFNLLNI